MKKIFSYFIALTILLGVTATSLSSANFINAQNNDDIKIITPKSFNPDNKKADLDLDKQDRETIDKLLSECEAGVLIVEYQNEPLILCLLDENKTIIFDSQGNTVNVKIDIKNIQKVSINNNNNDDDDDDDNDNNNRNGNDDYKKKSDRDCGDRGNFTQSFWDRMCDKFDEGGSNMTMGNGNSNSNGNGDSNVSEQGIPLIDLTQPPIDPVIPLEDIEIPTDETENGNGNEDTNDNAEELEKQVEEDHNDSDNGNSNTDDVENTVKDSGISTSNDDNGNDNENENDTSEGDSNN